MQKDDTRKAGLSTTATSPPVTKLPTQSRGGPGGAPRPPPRRTDTRRCAEPRSSCAPGAEPGGPRGAAEGRGTYWLVGGAFSGMATSSSSYSGPSSESPSSTAASPPAGGRGGGGGSGGKAAVPGSLGGGGAPAEPSASSPSAEHTAGPAPGLSPPEPEQGVKGPCGPGALPRQCPGSAAAAVPAEETEPPSSAPASAAIMLSLAPPSPPPLARPPPPPPHAGEVATKGPRPAPPRRGAEPGRGLNSPGGDGLRTIPGWAGAARSRRLRRAPARLPRPRRPPGERLSRPARSPRPRVPRVGGGGGGEWEEEGGSGTGRACAPSPCLIPTGACAERGV